MTEAEILVTLQQVFDETFQHEGYAVSRHTSALDVDGWDSLTHTYFILNVERAFAVKLPLEKTYGLTNVGELIDLIQILKAGQSA